MTPNSFSPTPTVPCWTPGVLPAPGPSKVLMIGGGQASAALSPPIRMPRATALRILLLKNMADAPAAGSGSARLLLHSAAGAGEAGAGIPAQRTQTPPVGHAAREDAGKFSGRLACSGLWPPLAGCAPCICPHRQGGRMLLSKERAALPQNGKSSRKIKALACNSPAPSSRTTAEEAAAVVPPGALRRGLLRGLGA